MKICLQICFCMLVAGTWSPSLGQGNPTPFAAHYTYGEKDGVPAGNAFTVMDQLEDGSVVMRIYGKEFVRVTPLGARPIHLGSSLKEFSLTEIASVGSGKGVFFGAYKGLIRLEGDSLQAFGKPINVLAAGVLPSGNYLLVTDSAGFATLHVFDGSQFTPLPLPPVFAGARSMQLTLSSNLPDNSVVLAGRRKLTDLFVFSYQETHNTWKQLAAYKTEISTDLLIHFTRNFNGDSSYIMNESEMRVYYPVASQKKTKRIALRDSHNGSRHIEAVHNGANKVLKDYLPGRIAEIPIATNEMAAYIQDDRFYNSIYVGLQTNPIRVFPHIRQIAHLYGPNHSRATLNITQGQDGTLFFGSYEGYATSLQQGTFRQIDVDRLHLLPGSTVINNKAYMFAELSSGILRLGSQKREGMVSTNFTYGYYITHSRDSSRMYAGFGIHKGIGIIARADMEAGRPNWRYIDSTKGVRVHNVITIAEDPHGRLWFGRISQGWGVYFPQHDTAVTYLRQEGTTTFGAMATYCDHKGTMWLGGSDGLWLANANKKDTITHEDVVRLQHPLLHGGTQVVSMAAWGHFLAFTAAQKLLLLDLDHFYRHQKDILSGKKLPHIHYLNPQELPLNTQAQWNQNCLLTDKTDSSLWVGANDNLYRIDLKTWLRLHRPHTIPTLQVIAGDDTLLLPENEWARVPPMSNSLAFNIFYQTLDNMPRLMQVALVADGDTARWSEPSTQTHFEAWNRQTGDYTFYIRIIEHDGAINEFAFPITIRRFLWQQWWFWLMLSILVGGVIFYYYYLYKQKQLAQANAARIVAESDALRAEQQRQLTAMQVKSLSTQFRPHFILNALNTIGAQLYDKPEVDAVLGQLGDSISIIFKNAQAGAIAHPLATEWRLVQGVIEIKQLEMRHAVAVHWQVEPSLLHNEAYKVPMGILQIPVENALVHGLRNKETGSRDLWLHGKIDAATGRLCIAITDNGIGRKAAALLTNYRSNGVGSRNLQSIVELLNPFNTQSITIDIEDLPLTEAGVPCGTRVTVCIPENYTYEH